MLKIIISIIIVIILFFYILLSAFAPTGETVTVRGAILSASEDSFWFAGLKGFARVTYTTPACHTPIENYLHFGQIATVTARVNDSFQMSICDAQPKGYFLVQDLIYSPNINELAP